MRIGIDAKWMTHGPPSGRRVVWNLVRGLIDVAGDHELHLFLDARASATPLPIDIPCDRRHYVWARNNQLSNVIVVPRVADRLALDAVVYQNFVPPADTARHKRVAVVHDVIFETSPELFTRRERLYFKPLRFLVSSADRVCTVSHCERERLVRYGYARQDRVDVIPNGVDRGFVARDALVPAAVERVRRDLDLPERFVLSVGRLNVRKNVETLIRALGRLTDRSVELVIAGAPDATTPDLAAVARAESVASRVRLVGAVSDEDLRVLYALAAVFCFPSLDEGFGLCPLEAMAAGAPCVVSDRPVLRETCGEAAVYVEPRDAAAWAASIDRLLADERRRAELVAAGTERVRAFTWDRAAQALVQSVRAAVESAA
jgi:glycosyltransferase involved in cell wall biosynthesis